MAVKKKKVKPEPRKPTDLELGLQRITHNYDEAYGELYIKTYNELIELLKSEVERTGVAHCLSGSCHTNDDGELSCSVDICKLDWIKSPFNSLKELNDTSEVKEDYLEGMSVGYRSGIAEMFEEYLPYDSSPEAFVLVYKKDEQIVVDGLND